MRLRRRAGPGSEAVRCSFCHKEATRRRKVVRRADGLYICDECVDRVIAALSSHEITKLRG